MKCQYCNQNDANISFIIYLNGNEQEIHLCEDCARKLRKYTEAMHNQFMSEGQTRQSGMWLPMVQTRPRSLGDDPFPNDAGAEVKNKRKMNELRAKLARAVETEEYEEAAGIRDEINRLQKEVLV